jgi:hypothetical protein
MRKRKPISGDKAMEILRQGIMLPWGQIVRLEVVDRLDTDYDYQRDLVMSSMDRIFHNFDPQAMGIFHVGERRNSTKLFTMDGQNRLEAIRRLLNDDVAHENVPSEVLCLVQPDTTKKIEAKLFVLLNTNKPVTGNSRFRARLVEHEEPEVTIKRWTEEEGYTLNFSSPGRPTHVNCPAGALRSPCDLLKVYHNMHDYLRPALQLLKMVWGNNKATQVPFDLCTGQVVRGIALFLRSQGEKGTPKGIAQHFKAVHVDLGEIWLEIRQTTGHGWDRARDLAERLKDACGLFRKAA